MARTKKAKAAAARMKQFWANKRAEASDNEPLHIKRARLRGWHRNFKGPLNAPRSSDENLAAKMKRHQRYKKRKHISGGAGLHRVKSHVRHNYRVNHYWRKRN